MFACLAGNVEIVELFLDHAESKSIDLNVTAGISGQQTAFTMACVSGNIDIVKLLLDHPEKVRSDINTALQMPKVLRNRKMCNFLDNHVESKNLSRKNKKS